MAEVSFITIPKCAKLPVVIDLYLSRYTVLKNEIFAVYFRNAFLLQHVLLLMS